MNMPQDLKTKIKEILESTLDISVENALNYILDFSEKLPVVGFFWGIDDIRRVAAAQGIVLTEEEELKVFKQIEESYNKAVGMNYNIISGLIEELYL